MRSYIRARIPGALYFFTLTLAERRDNAFLVENVPVLREAFRRTRHDHPFDIKAIVVLPDHLHCLWWLPARDVDYSTRLRLIKARFSAALPPGERISASRQRKGERGIWQRRFWEHVIRDEQDYQRHFDYIHFNPVKHGYVEHARDWPYSSFHRWVEHGLYPRDWTAPDKVRNLEVEE